MAFSIWSLGHRSRRKWRTAQRHVWPRPLDHWFLSNDLWVRVDHKVSKMVLSTMQTAFCKQTHVDTNKHEGEGRDNNSQFRYIFYFGCKGVNHSSNITRNVCPTKVRLDMTQRSLCCSFPVGQPGRSWCTRCPVSHLVWMKERDAECKHIMACIHSFKWIQPKPCLDRVSVRD